MVKKIVIMSVLLLVLVIGGIGGLLYNFAKEDNEIHIPSVEDVSKNGYPVNDSGLTYGPYIRDGIHGDPDLILVMNDDGVSGYVYAIDFNGEEITTSEEAIAKAKEGIAIIAIPMYLQDGKTVIGEFELGQ